MENIKSAIEELNKLKNELKSKEREYVSEFRKYGVIGLHDFDNHRVQLSETEDVEKIANGKPVNIEERGSEFEYPYEISVIVDGIVYFTILSKEDYEEWQEISAYKKEG